MIDVYLSLPLLICNSRSENTCKLVVFHQKKCPIFCFFVWYPWRILGVLNENWWIRVERIVFDPRMAQAYIQTWGRERERRRKNTCSYDYLPIHTNFLINDVLSIYSFSWVPSVLGTVFGGKKNLRALCHSKVAFFSEYRVLLEVCMYALVRRHDMILWKVRSDIFWYFVRRLLYEFLDQLATFWYVVYIERIFRRCVREKTG